MIKLEVSIANGYLIGPSTPYRIGFWHFIISFSITSRIELIIEIYNGLIGLVFQYQPETVDLKNGIEFGKQLPMVWTSVLAKVTKPNLFVL